MVDETKKIEELELEQEDDVIMLLDEDNNEVPFHHITTIEFEGAEYVYLQEVTTDEEGGAIEIFALTTVEEDGEEFDSLEAVDEAQYEKLYGVLVEAINAEGEHECSCGHDGCDCGGDCDCDD